MSGFVDSTIKPIVYEDKVYGALANNLPDHSDEKYYLTTAIAYTNGFPHIGHAYEFLSSDIIVRYNRVLGKNTFFLTGTDEHGQKVAASAEKNGLTPLEHCNKYVDSFLELHKRLLTSYSYFQRTTEAHHEETSRKLWEICHANGDIYLDTYEGWYNEREETFVSDKDAAANDYKDPGNGVPLKRVVEESYFFRMSNYCEKLIAYIEQNPHFIEPELHRMNILARLTKEGLKDLSISRTSFTWGISVPKGFDQKHVMYVWFDALTNYLTGIHALEPDHPLASFWPANNHIIGKDIVWFHCVIWPCMLMSANIPLPECVFSHGFVNASDGRKMSKSYGNTVDPIDVLNKYSIDTLRYYCASSITYGADINFSEESMIAMHNSELADILGNLVHRVMNLCVKYCDGIIPDVQHDPQFALPFDLAAIKASIEQDVSACAINAAVFKGMDAARATNRWLTEAEPWKMKGENEYRRIAVVRTAMEALYAFMHVLSPVIPVAGQQVFEKLGTSPVSLKNLRDDFYNLTPGTPISVGDVLFKKIEDESAAAVVAAGGKPATKGKPAPAPVEVEHLIDFTKVDIRVGLITKVWNHETSDRLYCEEIDVGESTGPRQVASGLRKNYTLDQMLNRKVLVVCNLKESKFQGFMSYGMVLAVKSADGETVELLAPHPDSKVGEKVFLTGYESFAQEGVSWQAAKMKKMKVWEAVVPLFATNALGVPAWNGLELQTSQGALLPTTLFNAQIQ